MIIKLYYKDPEADYEHKKLIKEENKDLRPYSEEYWKVYYEHMRQVKEVFGKLGLGSEDLHISMDTDVRGIVVVNGDKYKLIK